MKTLHYFIIVVFLTFAGLLLSYDNNAYGIWVRQSPPELIDQSRTIFVGNITSVNTLHLQKAQFYTMEVNGTDKNFVRNYTLNLDEYSVDVAEFLKNPQNTNKITVRQPTIGLPTGLGALGGFKAGDRVLFYIKNLDGINEYSPESFVIPQFCIAKDVLTQKRVEGSNNFTVIQNGIKVDYGNFTANTPLKFIYDRDVDTLDGKSFDVLVYVTKNTGSSSDGIVFSKDIHAESKPCEWVASTEWGFTLGEGKYRMNITVKDNNSTYSESYTDFIVKPNVIIPNYVSPLKQFKSGIAANDVKCEQGLQLVIKTKDGSPACARPQTAQKLVERKWGWAMQPIDSVKPPPNSISGFENDVGMVSLKNQTYYFDTPNYTKTSYIHPVQIAFHDVNFTLFPPGFRGGLPLGGCPGQYYWVDVKFADGTAELLQIYAGSQSCADSVPIMLSNHILPQAGLTFSDGKMRLLVRDENQAGKDIVLQKPSSMVKPFPHCNPSPAKEKLIREKQQILADTLLSEEKKHGGFENRTQNLPWSSISYDCVDNALEVGILPQYFNSDFLPKYFEKIRTIVGNNIDIVLSPQDYALPL